MSRNPQANAPPFQHIQLLTNSFEITQLPQKTYHQYDVVFDPPEKIRNKKIQLIHHLQTAVAPNVFNPRLVYDGQAIAYSPRKLPLAGNGNGTFIVKLGVSTPVPPGSKGAYQIRLTLTSGGEIEPRHVNDLIKDRTSTTRALVATNLIQLVVRQGPNQNFTNNGRAYFTGREKVSLQKDGVGIELWRGIFQSVRPTPGKMVLTIDTCTAAVYQSGPMIELCMTQLRVQNAAQLDLREHHADFKKLEKFFKGLRITVKTGHGRSRIKTIRGIVPQAGEYTFSKNDQDITVARHFQEAYGMRISYPRIIGVRLTGKNAPNQDIVPAELCNIEPGQLFKRKLPETSTTEMVRFATMKPKERLRRIEEAVRDYDRSEFVQESGMQVNTKPISIKAKLLSLPAVFCDANSRPLELKNGGWNVVRQRFTDPQGFEHWAVVNFCTKFNDQAVENMLGKGLLNSCRNLGMATNPPYTYVNGMAHDTVGSLGRVMQNTAQKFQGTIPEPVLRRLIIIAILPESAGPVRNAIKFWGDVQYGIMTLCLREGKVARSNDQYWNNIALKLNARLGGVNFFSVSPAMKELLSVPVMIMGADVGHPGPGIQKPSVTSVVYSNDKHGAQYVALTGIQPPRTEKILALRRYVKMAVENFGAIHNGPPRRLIFFRDGISEGEYDKVGKEEIKEIQGACEELWAEKGAKVPIPSLTFIIVGKRHHAVFFPPSDQQADRTGNCHPGSLIDSEVTHPAVADFYLQSHAAIQGTCRSSHYIVLHDENFNFQLGKIQDLAYTLCHVYAKATRSVSIPAPVYYADLVCSRGVFHVDPTANLQFDDTASTVSGGTPSLDMDLWGHAFKNVHPRLERTMYFL